MKGILTMVLNLLPEAYRKTKNKLDAEQFIAVLQGITGFAAAIKGKDPVGFIDSAVGIMDYEINKPCLKSLGTIRKNLKKWLTFGKEYKPLKDSSDLNFDKVKVSAIPEVMKVRSWIFTFKLPFLFDFICENPKRNTGMYVFLSNNVLERTRQKSFQSPSVSLMYFGSRKRSSSERAHSHVWVGS